MSHSAQSPARQSEGESRESCVPPEPAIDLEAENVRLRAALARSEGAGVRRDLITQELKHRIGNLLAVVQAVARQTFANADAPSLEDFSARLLALGAAQKLLIESETRAATIAGVVATALAPHCVDGERATFSGPVLALDGRRAHGLTLALHELATNAAKYGALSIEGGWIEVVWTARDGQLDFLWREHNGPPTSPPTRQGFGSRLIIRNLGIAFGGSVDLSFKPSGVECRLIAPLCNSLTDASAQATPASAA
jgi:two-component sensor histidine kinase